MTRDACVRCGVSRYSVRAATVSGMRHGACCVLHVTHPSSTYLKLVSCRLIITSPIRLSPFSSRAARHVLQLDRRRRQWDHQQRRAHTPLLTAFTRRRCRCGRRIQQPTAAAAVGRPSVHRRGPAGALRRSGGGSGCGHRQGGGRGEGEGESGVGRKGCGAQVGGRAGRAASWRISACPTLTASASRG